MHQAPQEVEAKFLLTDAAAVGQLVTAPRLAAAFLAAGSHKVETEDTYYDTADFRLLRSGWGLRIRRLADGRLATIKALGLDRGAPLAARTEIEEALPDAAQITSRSDWPEPLVQALDPLLKADAPLAAICHLHQERIKRAVYLQANDASADTPPFAELSIDAVSISSAEDGPVLARFDELEVELRDGDQADLSALAAAIAAELPVTPSQTSKLERALQVLGRHPSTAPENWQGIHPEMHIAEACRLIWRDQLTNMLLNEAGVRFSDDPEYVHDMRVAIRRARAALTLYGDYFRPKAIRCIRKGLRRTAKALGAVRDLDVAIARLEQYADRPARNADLNEKLEEWRGQRAAAHADLQDWLGSKRYATFLTEWYKFCITSGRGVRDFATAAGQAPTPHQVRHVIPSMILSRFEDVRAFETIFESTDAPPPEVLHRLRIACKYLRYNLEFVRNLLGARGDVLIESLRILQDNLGDLNDAAVSKRMLGDTEATLEPGQMRYRRAQDKAIARLQRKAGAEFAHFVAPTNRQRLALAIARI